MALHRDIVPLGDGPLQRVDGRVKIIVSAMLACAMAITQTLWVAAFYLAIAAVLLACARPHLRFAFRRLCSGNIFLAVAFLSLAFTYPGHAWAPMPLISVEGARLGALIVCKGNAMLMALLALLLSTSFPALTTALRKLGCPKKITLLLGFVYRQLFLTAEELERMRTVARLRCFTPKTNLHTYRTFAWFISQSLLRATDRAERIRSAMLARGFAGHFHSLQTSAPLRVWEVCACFVVAALSVFLTVLDRGLFS